MRNLFYIFMFLLTFFTIQKSNCQSLNFNGQAIFGAAIKFGDPFAANSVLRYIPELSYEKQLGKSRVFDFEASCNGYATVSVDEENIVFDADFKPYRLWTRYSGSQFELRAGLQKINFGSAMMLRPLMWFDKIDPRDPLNLTNGVYALLGRYYFTNNANVWLWGLIGNKELKGWETYNSSAGIPEFGGRIQLPLPKGEAAVSYHHRLVDISEQANMSDIAEDETFGENRFGIDIRMDIIVGLWLEGSIVHQDVLKTAFPYRKYVTVGIDYTFNIGNGLQLTKELFFADASGKLTDSEQSATFSALSLIYPLGLTDNITAMVYYDYANNEWYRFISWQRMYDKWSFYLMVFWNPDEIRLYRDTDTYNSFTGTGVQVILTYNH